MLIAHCEPEKKALQPASLLASKGFEGYVNPPCFLSDTCAIIKKVEALGCNPRPPIYKYKHSGLVFTDIYF